MRYAQQSYIIVSVVSVAWFLPSVCIDLHWHSLITILVVIASQIVGARLAFKVLDDVVDRNVCLQSSLLGIQAPREEVETFVQNTFNRALVWLVVWTVVAWMTFLTAWRLLAHRLSPALGIIGMVAALLVCAVLSMSFRLSQQVIASAVLPTKDETSKLVSKRNIGPQRQRHKVSRRILKVPYTYQGVLCLLYREVAWTGIIAFNIGALYLMSKTPLKGFRIPFFHHPFISD